jgi:hypothetical protein
MDCRFKPGNDGGEAVAGILRPFEREPLLAYRPNGCDATLSKDAKNLG